MSDKYIHYDGLKFTRDDKTGYYLNSTIRKRLHRYVWEKHNGEIPKGHHIHHMDGNKNNNDISNLQLLRAEEHAFHHGKEPINIQKMKEKVQPIGIKKAVDWHRSEEGYKWHKEHYEQMKDKFHVSKEFTCEYCGTLFQSIDTKQNRFCSNKCKSAWRRASGIDDEVRKCEHCGNEFKANKYSKTRFCSKSCSNKSVVRLPQLKKSNT